MALSASHASEARSFSVGPIKQQLIVFSIANGDTSGTITCDSLSTVLFAIVSGVSHTAAPTYATNVVTLAFADPTATRMGQCVAYGY